jgi:hypothetical protein
MKAANRPCAIARHPVTCTPGYNSACRRAVHMGKLRWTIVRH